MNYKQLNYSVDEVNELLDKIDNIESDKLNKIIFMPVVRDVSELIAGGECSCIISKTGKVVLIDTGASHSFELIKEQLIKNNVTKIDYLIISHYHSDHCQNLDSLITNFDMSETIYYLCKHTEKFTYSDNYVLSAIGANEKIYPNTNDILKVDDLTFTFCNCDQSDIDFYDANSTNYNDYSLCCYCENSNFSVFFSGDINIAAQDRLASLGMLKKVNVLKVEHHGCDTSVNHGYIKQLNPEYAVISDSDNNKYGKANNILCESVMIQTSMGTKCYCTGKETIIYTFDDYNSHINGTMIVNTVSKTHRMYNNVYIDKTYNGNSDGSYYRPFRTVREALAYAYTLLPCNVLIKTKDDSVFESTEHLRITNFYANIKLQNIKLRQLNILNSNFTLENVEVYDTDDQSVIIDQSNGIITSLVVNGSILDADSEINGRGMLVYNSKLHINNLEINDKRVALSVYNSSDVYIKNLKGSGNEYANICLSGSTLGVSYFELEYTKKRTFDIDSASRYTGMDFTEYLNSGDDLNTLTKRGTRFISNTGAITQSLLNIPSGIGYAMVLTVEKQTEDGSLMQVIRSRHFTGTNETGIWVRTYNPTDSWSNWFKIL